MPQLVPLWYMHVAKCCIEQFVDDCLMSILNLTLNLAIHLLSLISEILVIKIEYYLLSMALSFMDASNSVRQL